MQEEVVLALPKPLLATTQVRSTLICASIQSLRQRGLYDAYLAELTEPQRQDAMALTAGSWLPVQTAVNHYLACDRLPLSDSDRITIGGDVARRVQHSLLNLLVRLSREGGATPWSVVTSAEKLRAQTWKGGGIHVVKTGPKDMRLSWHQQPCAQSTHFRLGFVGIVQGLFELFSRKAFVSEDKRGHERNTVTIVGAWA
ncbi:MAG: hypothetical protein ACXVEF_31080 [Polyangiales bacterium]